jgi:hypothetical protein
LPPGSTTDGEVWDTQRMIASAQRSGHRVFVIGVGRSPAKALLRHLAEATGGACEFTTPGEALEAAAQRMLQRMRQSVWTGLRVDWGLTEAPHWELPTPMRSGGLERSVERDKDRNVCCPGLPVQACTSSKEPVAPGLPSPHAPVARIGMGVPKYAASRLMAACAA